MSQNVENEIKSALTSLSDILAQAATQLLQVRKNHDQKIDPMMTQSQILGNRANQMTDKIVQDNVEIDKIKAGNKPVEMRTTPEPENPTENFYRKPSN